jgi:hypothetical protein
LFGAGSGRTSAFYRGESLEHHDAITEAGSHTPEGGRIELGLASVRDLESAPSPPSLSFTDSAQASFLPRPGLSQGPRLIRIEMTKNSVLMAIS